MEEKIELKNRIHVFGDFYMVADAFQFILIERVVRQSKKDGSVYEDFETVGYYSKLASLCKSALKKSILREIRDGYLKTLEDVIRREERIERAIEDAVGNKV